MTARAETHERQRARALAVAAVWFDVSDSDRAAYGEIRIVTSAGDFTRSTYHDARGYDEARRLAESTGAHFVVHSARPLVEAWGREIDCCSCAECESKRAATAARGAASSPPSPPHGDGGSAPRASVDADDDQLAKLARDLRVAKEAAQAAADAVEDEGTCNFDNVRLFGLRWSRKVVDAARAAGVTAERRHWLRRPCIELGFGTGGQAAKRSKAAQVASEVLRARGWDTTVYFQMD